MYYILKGKCPVYTEDILEWGRYIGRAVRRSERHVGHIEMKKGIFISTLFLGMDQEFTGGRAPLLFETMIFGGRYDHNIDRYSNWEQAERGYKKWIAIIKGDLLYNRLRNGFKCQMLRVGDGGKIGIK